MKKLFEILGQVLIRTRDKAFLDVSLSKGWNTLSSFSIIIFNVEDTPNRKKKNTFWNKTFLCTHQELSSFFRQVHIHFQL